MATILRGSMPLPLVAISVEDSRLPADAAQVIVASCARVSGNSRCVEERNSLAPAALYAASVHVIGDGKLHVALRRRHDNQPLAERELVFASTDLSREHYNSAGLVVAALVADAEPPFAPLEHASSRPAAATTLPPGTTMTPAAAGRDVWARVDMAGLACRGFGFDPWRLGLQTKFAFGAGHFALYPVLAVRWSTASGQVEAKGFSAALGFGARLIEPEDRLGLELELSAVSDSLLVSAATAQGTEQSFRSRLGARLALTSSFRLVSEVYAVAGADTTWLSHRAVVEVDGERVGAEPRYVPGFTLGLSVRL
jgi:hypothetical protein